MAKVTLGRIREIARKIKQKFLANPNSDLKDIIIDVLLDGNTDLKENHIRTLVHIVNNLIFFTLTKELNTTAVTFKSIPDNELIEAYADRIRAIKEQFLARMKEKEKSKEDQMKAEKIAAEVDIDNVTVEDIERMKSTYKGKYINGLPIQFSDFWRNFININNEEKQASFTNPVYKIYKNYRPIIRELEKLGVDFDYKRGPQHIISVANKTRQKLLILKNDLMGELLKNTTELYDIIAKIQKTLANIMGMSFLGRGANLDVIYTLTRRYYSQLDSLAEPIPDIPLEFDVPENDFMDFRNVIEYIIQQFKSTGRLAPDYELAEIDTISSYAYIDHKHPYWNVIMKYIGIIDKRRLILKQAREIQNILDSLENANNTFLGGQL